MPRKVNSYTITCKPDDWEALTKRAKELGISRSKLMVTMGVHQQPSKEVRIRLGIE